MTARVAIGLGSNLGKPERQILIAVRALEHVPGVTPLALSSAYRTEPIGPPQPRYLNAVLVVETTLEAEALLSALHGIEAAMGRRRGMRYGPRIIDLDVLLLEGRVIETPRLSAPHPRLCERAFALVPLLEVWPGACDPGTGRRLADVLSGLGDQGIGPPRPLPARVGRRSLPHTADVAFAVTGSSIEDAMERAATALVDLMVVRRDVVERDRMAIDLTAGDHVELMVGLLEELVFLVDARSFAPRRVGGLRIDGGRLTATVYGEPDVRSEQLGTRVKAVTYHGAEIVEARAGRWTATVTVDV
jgi:2-amino-4-hydroxy-6-hydroxymethyldihydropteridine diphosphokinase